MPTVSVIIPVYNGEQYILSALESVLAQTYQNFEILVVDDGSTDNTTAIVKTFPDVQCVRHAQTAGVSKARNTGIRNATGPYIAFLDCDDIWYPEKLELQVPLLEQDPKLSVIYCDQEWIDEKINTRKSVKCSNWSKGYEKVFYGGHNVGPSTMLVRKEVLERAGLFDENLWFTEDKDLLIRLYDLCEFRCVDQVLIKKRRSSRKFSVRHGQSEKVLESHRKFLLKLARRSLTAEQRRFLEEEWSVYYSEMGKHMMQKGQRVLALKNFVLSLARDPLRIKTYGRLVRCLFGLR